jgi:hypothetical protein
MTTHEDFLIDSLKDSEETAAYLTAILEEKDPEPELLPLGLSHVSAALGNDRDRQWVKDFAANNKSQSVYEFARWLDSQGLRLQITLLPHKS